MRWRLLTPPADPSNTVADLGDYLRISGVWRNKHEPQDKKDGYLSQFWYRGVGKHFPNQVPEVYRKDFTDRVKPKEPQKFSN